MKTANVHAKIAHHVDVNGVTNKKTESASYRFNGCKLRAVVPAKLARHGAVSSVMLKRAKVLSPTRCGTRQTTPTKYIANCVWLARGKRDGGPLIVLTAKHSCQKKTLSLHMQRKLRGSSRKCKIVYATPALKHARLWKCKSRQITFVMLFISVPDTDYIFIFYSMAVALLMQCTRAREVNGICLLGA